MQNDPNEDTVWNDILRSKGILPPKPKEKEITEEDLVNLVENTINEKTDEIKRMEKLSLDELDELEDDEDEFILRQFRERRIAELKALAKKSKFGEVIEISGQDYIEQVNKAGLDIWVVLVLYRPGIPVCKKINEYLAHLAPKYPTVKFIKSISITCIPNYPDANLPTLFVYCNGEQRYSLTSADVNWLKTSLNDFEKILHFAGALPKASSDDEETNTNSRPRDVLFSQLKNH